MLPLSEEMNVVSPGTRLVTSCRHEEQDEYGAIRYFEREGPRGPPHSHNFYYSMSFLLFYVIVVVIIYCA